jgi:hypothetical protein
MRNQPKRGKNICSTLRIFLKTALGGADVISNLGG